MGKSRAPRCAMVLIMKGGPGGDSLDGQIPIEERKIQKEKNNSALKKPPTSSRSGFYLCFSGILN